MGILRGLNPFTYSTKYHASWNALMAAYTFAQLSAEQRQDVMDKVAEIESSVQDEPVTFSQAAPFFSEAQLNHYFSLAMMNLGIRPALGKDLWFEVKNPNIDLLNGDEVLPFVKHKLEKQFGVKFPDLSLHRPWDQL